MLDLEERYKELKNEENEPKAILKIIFEEEYTADIDKLQELSGLDKLTIGRVKGGVGRRLSAARAREEAREAVTPDQEGEVVQEEKIQEGVYKRETDRATILRSVLEKHPDIKKGQVEEVLEWEKLTRGGIHPAFLFNLLMGFKGIDSRTANMLAQKYNMALNKAQMELASAPAMMVPGQGYSSYPTQQIPFTPGRPQQFWPPQQSMYQRPQQPPPGMVTTEDLNKAVAKALEEQKREHKLETIEKSVDDLRHDLPRIIQDNVPQTSNVQFEVIEIPLNAEGKPCKPEEAVSVSKMTRPVKASGDSSFFDQVIELQKAGVPVFGSKGTDEATLRKILQEEKGTAAEDSPVLKELKEQYKETTKKFEAFQEKMSEKEKADMKETIKKLEEKIDRVSTRPVGINTPEGVLATAVTEAGRREPIKVIVEGAKEIMGQKGIQTKPLPQPGKQAPPEARGGVISALSEKGLVARVRDRVRVQQ